MDPKLLTENGWKEIAAMFKFKDNGLLRALADYEKLPDDPFAPIMVISAKLNARLDERSEKKWIMAGLTELRPGNFFELYVELELWKNYVKNLPREPD